MNTRAELGNRDWMVLAALFVVLLVGCYFAATPGPAKVSDVSTSYSPDPKGVKAFYTLLGERLGFRLARLEKRLDEMPPDTAVLITVEPVFPIDWDEIGHVRSWVERGGTAIVLSDELSDLPPELAATRRFGRGSVFAFPKRGPITNRGMRDYCNAMMLLRIIAPRAARGGPILFDEYHHGITTSRSLASMTGRQVKAALAMLAAAALIACYGCGRRFGAVRRSPSEMAARPATEFVDAVGRLYRRARASDVAAAVLCDSFKHELCAKLGLAADAPADEVARGLGTAPLGDRVRNLLDRCERFRAGESPSQAELQNVAAEIHRLERELGLAGARY